MFYIFSGFGSLALIESPASQDVSLHGGCQVAVMLFDHQDRSAHLSGEVVDRNAVLNQRHGGVRVAKRVQGSVLLVELVAQESIMVEELLERGIQILCLRAVA